MSSDLKLDGDYVIAEGLEVTFDRGSENSSTALNLKNPLGFWHISGPRSYEPNGPLSIYWHNNSNFSFPFLSIINTGNVGIGTSNPTNKLHVVGSGPVTIENPTGEADILFQSGNNPSWQVGTNSKGWYVWDNAYRFVVRPGGSIGIGTTNPLRILHVEGNEIHSGGSGAGFSFSDRNKPTLIDNPQSGERWVWYAQSGSAKLWSGKDIFSIQSNGYTTINGTLEVQGELRAKGPVTLNGRDTTLADGKQVNVIGLNAEAIYLQAIKNNFPENLRPRLALFHEFNLTQKDKLVINYQGSYKDGVTMEGNVQVTGVLTHASSISLKENITELSGQEAMTTLKKLNAVKYNYKADHQKAQYLGFIAEEVPDLVASPERDRISSMDIIAVLTKAMQEMEKIITDLTKEVNSLKGQN